MLPEAVCGMKKEGVRVRQGQEWCCDCAALGVKAGRWFDKMLLVVHSLNVLVPHSMQLFLTLPGILCVAPTALGVLLSCLMTLQQHKSGSAGRLIDLI